MRVYGPSRALAKIDTSLCLLFSFSTFAQPSTFNIAISVHLGWQTNRPTTRHLPPDMAPMSAHMSPMAPS